MGVLTHLVERRDSLENPKTSLSNPDAWLWDAFGATPSRAGVRVSERTALHIVPVFAAVRLLANTLATLPWLTYKRLAVGKERAPTHPTYRLLHDRPNPEMTPFTFREALMGHLLLWGNAYAEIERDNSGQAIALWPLRPDATVVKRRPTGEKYYETTVDGRAYPLPAADVFHVPGLSFDGLVGYSPIRLHRESLGLTVAAEEYGARFFGDGSQPRGVLTHPGKLTTEAKIKLKDQWKSAYTGLANSHRTAILEEGVGWQAIGLPPEDSQFLETRKFQVTETARMFGVPPHMIGDMERATFSNIEHMQIGFGVYSVLPWSTRWEQVANWACFRAPDRGAFFSEFSMEGLLRGDSQQRATFYKEMFATAVFSVNDIREKENLNPVEGGEQRFVPLNMVPLDAARDLALRPKAVGAPSAKAGRAVDERALLPLCREVVERMLKRETVQLRRAAKRPADGFGAWVDEFYQEHEETIARAYEPLVESLARLVLADGNAQRFARDWSADCAARHVLHSREEVTTLAGVMPGQFETRTLALAQQWEGDRVVSLALSDATRLAAALHDVT